MLIKSSNNKLEEDIFTYFHKGSKDIDVDELSAKYGLAVKQIEQILDAHYYLSPRNLRKAQFLIGFLTIILSLTITIVRTNNDWFLIFVSLVVGISASIPFFIIYMLVRDLGKLSRFEALVKLSLIYLVFLAGLFSMVAINSDVYGAILIPALVIGFYVLELVKFHKLKHRLTITSGKKRHKSKK